MCLAEQKQISLTFPPQPGFPLNPHPHSTRRGERGGRDKSDDFPPVFPFSRFTVQKVVRGKKIDKLTQSSSRVQAIIFFKFQPRESRESGGLKFSRESSTTGCQEMKQQCGGGGAAKLATVLIDFV